MAGEFDLERFVVAQEPVYSDVLKELRGGRKTTHWMWFVFPQLRGLGSTTTADYYGVASLQEARAYLAHPVLGARLVECAQLLLAIPDRSAEQILGSIDALKLRSSMTLFQIAAPQESVFGEVLDSFYGGRADPLTLGMLDAGGTLVMQPLTLTPEELTFAAAVVRQHVPPTPTRRWPLLERATGTETWVKHENHNPTGAFKVRGGLTFMARLTASGERRGVVSASRGNHSQSLAFAGAAFGIPVTIVVPEGNSPDKNAATEAFGARLVVYGADFQEALEHSQRLAAEEGLIAVPPFHPWLVQGVATAAEELHRAVPDLDVIYVPIGMGSNMCANIAVRDLKRAGTQIVGVVAERAPAYALSFAAGRAISTEAADTFVDGVACRTPDPVAVATILQGASRIVQVSEEAAAQAMALMFRSTHQLAEPAGSLGLAGILAEKHELVGKRVAFIQTGGNADFDVLQHAFALASN